MTQQNRSVAITKRDSGTLVPTDPKLVAVAMGLKWKAETAITRIESALPTVFERKLYLTMMEGLKGLVLPETFAKILDLLTRGQGLIEADTKDRSVGENLVTNRFVEVGETLEVSLELLEWSRDEEGLSISAETAACLAQAYGDGAQEILDMILGELEFIKGAARFPRRMSRSKTFATIVSAVAQHAMNGNIRPGMPLVVTAEEVVRLVASPLGAEDSDAFQEQNEEF